ncbi:peptidase M24 [Rickenella mellea]|uniref:Peptidase M24 n=1 Tax=Rickenella mellea TaxID=50990 RepID=A0A4R5XDA0_9AGAM|nr:peptidase M24 [Rickenella mellea]
MANQFSYRIRTLTVKRNELTPGILAEEYERRRALLMQQLPERSMVVSLAGQVKYLSGEIFYKFRQASDFWYLTGFEEPESAIILEKTSDSKGYRMTMFSQGKDAAKEKWEGARADLNHLGSIFGADDARPIEQFPSHLKSISSAYSNIYLDIPSTSSKRGKPKFLQKYLTHMSGRSSGSESILDSLADSKRQCLAPEIAKLRIIKSEAEQRVMRAAADISARAHTKTMRFTHPGLSESALAAHFEYICGLSGAQRMAYVPVVASGPNALVIHYTSNNHLVRDGELVLMDAGCEYNGYASDITRTYPVNGVYSPPQRDLYAAVLSAQKACMALCTQSNGLSLNDIHRQSCELLRQELNQIGFSLSSGEVEHILYPHYLSHPIGIDLHESTYFDRSNRLVEGMVVTIEPGIYVPPSSSYPHHFHNIGIRIEDEVLVGKNHPTILSVNAPKEIVDVEAACQGSLGLEPY